MGSCLPYTAYSSCHASGKNPKSQFPQLPLWLGVECDTELANEIGVDTPESAFLHREQALSSTLIPPASSYRKRGRNARDSTVILKPRGTRKESKGLLAKDGNDIGKQASVPSGISESHLGPGGLPWVSCHLGQEAASRSGLRSEVLSLAAECVSTFPNGGAR